MAGIGREVAARTEDKVPGGQQNADDRLFDHRKRCRGMNIAHQLLTETNANIVVVDRHHVPGDHWNDAYSFVHLHAPSAFYGVGSRQLGSNRIDVSDPLTGLP
jgi:hypothetical protein